MRGINEVVDPERGGVLFPFEMEAEQLASLVIDTLQDKERMSWRRAASIQHAREKFGLERMAQAYIRIYQEALRRPRRPPVRMRMRLWLAPLLNWSEYIERRWTAGQCHYEVSRKLAEQGEWGLARAAARLSVFTCPSLYTRPGRLAHLCKILVSPISLVSGGKH